MIFLKLGIIFLFFIVVLLFMLTIVLKASETNSETQSANQPQQPLPQIRYFGGVYQTLLMDALEKILAKLPASFHLDSVPLPAFGHNPYPVPAYCFKVHYTGTTVTKKELEKIRQHLNALILNWIEKEKNYLLAASPYITHDEFSYFYPLLAVGFSAISVSFTDNYIVFYIVILDNEKSASLANSRI